MGHAQTQTLCAGMRASQCNPPKIALKGLEKAESSHPSTHLTQHNRAKCLFPKILCPLKMMKIGEFACEGVAVVKQGSEFVSTKSKCCLRDLLVALAVRAEAMSIILALSGGSEPLAMA